MYRYAVSNRGDVISKLDNGQNYPGNVYENKQDLGNGDTIMKGRFRCYKWKIINDKPVEQIIKRYGITDENNDIVSEQYYNKLPTNGHEIQDDLIIKDEKYNVPKYFLDGSIVKIKPNIGDRPELAEKIKSISDKEIENKILEKYSIGKEINYTKDLLNWIVDGKPENDSRETKYNEMKIEIDKIKAGN